MPKSKKEGGLDGPYITKMPFRSFNSVLLTESGNTSGKIDLTLANLGERAYDAGQNFEFFRVPRMRVTVFTDAFLIGTSTVLVGSGGTICVAFDNSNSADVVTPTSFTNATQFRHCTIQRLQDRRTFYVPKAELFGGTPTKWYNTYTTGSPPAMLGSCGSLLYYTSFTSSTVNINDVYMTILVEGEIEFHTPVDYNLSLVIPPPLVENPRVVKLRAQLKKVISEESSATEGAKRT